MKAEEIKKQQKDRLREHAIKQKEVEIQNIKTVAEIRIKRIKKDIKYLKQMNN